MTRTSATPAGARRRRRSSLRCCLAAAAAALAARTPSKLMTHALVSNAPVRVAGTRTLASSYRSGIGAAGASKMQASSSFGADGTRRRRGDRGRRGGGDVQRFGLGARTLATRSWKALAASRENEGVSGGGGDDVEESSVAGVWAVQDEEDWEFEEEVQRLEERLERAVKNEDYKGAAKCRDELYRIHMDETSAVLSTNSAFYAAFTAKDADRMTSLWMPSNDVMCVHPGDEPVLGQQAVARSWRSLFRSGDGRFSSSVIKPTDVRIRVRGTTAIVQCNEKVTTRLPSAADAFTRSSPSPSSSSSSPSDGDGDGGGFSKDPEHSDAAAWLAHVIADSPYEPGSEQSIVSNPTTAEDRAKIKKAVGEHGVASIKKAVDKAFSQTDDSAGGRGRKKKGAAAVAAAAAAAGRRKKVKPRFLNATNIYRKAGGRWLMVHHHASLPPPPKTSNDRRAAMGMDGMKDGMEGMTRIVNLSDLGAGGFGGSIGGGKENKLEEMLEALRNRLPGALGGSIGGGGAERLASGMIIIGGDDDNDDEEEEEEEEEEENDDDDDGEDDDDDEEEDDEEDDGHDARSSISNSEGKERRDSRWTKEELPLTEDLTNKTIQTLRTLVEIKVLEKDEQRRLMTDVIQHATGEEASPVEVAYELLLAHTNEDLEDTDSLAEFVDQCKILAASLFKEDEKKTKRRRWRR